MLERDEDHARRAVGVPVRREVIRAACGGATVAARRAKGEMPVVIDHGILHVGMLVVVARQEYRRAEVDGMSPPSGQQLTLDLDALDVIVVRGECDGRNDLGG